MSMICTTVTDWVTKEILVPVDTWVTQQQQTCKQYPWWDPRGWFCEIVTTVVRVVIWVTQQILIPVAKTICIAVTGTIGVILYPFAIAIDAVCSSCNVVTWVQVWWLGTPKIKFVGKVPSLTRPGYDEYTFICICSRSKQTTIKFEAQNDEQAAEMAKDQCQKECA